MNSSDPSTPMEQLSQQVQRLPNPPQINVIPQHQMQAPQPPQLHAGRFQLSKPFAGTDLFFFDDGEMSAHTPQPRGHVFIIAPTSRLR